MRNQIYIHFGVVMYEMVTGRVPFDADTPVSVALKHMQEEPIEPIILNSSLPISVNKIILKAMKKDPDYRYQSATEMISDLNLALKNQEMDSNNQENNNSKEQLTKKVEIEEINKEKNKENGKDEKRNIKFAKTKKFFNKHKLLKIFTIIFSALLVFIISMGITFAVLMGRKS